MKKIKLGASKRNLTTRKRMARVPKPGASFKLPVPKARFR